MLAAHYLAPFAGIASLWFIGVIRDRIGIHEDQLFATVFLGSGLLFVGMYRAAAAELASLVAGSRYDSAPPSAWPRSSPSAPRRSPSCSSSRRGAVPAVRGQGSRGTTIGKARNHD